VSAAACNVWRTSRNFVGAGVDRGATVAAATANNATGATALMRMSILESIGEDTVEG
jgi:hypothetical protein